MKTRIAAPMMPAILMAGCAAPDMQSPSLAPRAIEQRSEEVQTPPPAPPAPASAELAADLMRLLDQARGGDRAFAAALPVTERAVAAARNAAVSSESWVAAQQALSNLDTVRAPTASALAELDSLFIALANTAAGDASVGGVAEAERARAEIEQLYNRQLEQLTGLRQGITGP